jgi:hypothetical protein
VQQFWHRTDTRSFCQAVSSRQQLPLSILANQVIGEKNCGPVIRSFSNPDRRLELLFGVGQIQAHFFKRTSSGSHQFDIWLETSRTCHLNFNFEQYKTDSKSRRIQDRQQISNRHYCLLPIRYLAQNMTNMSLEYGLIWTAV